MSADGSIECMLKYLYKRSLKDETIACALTETQKIRNRRGASLPAEHPHSSDPAPPPSFVASLDASSA